MAERLSAFDIWQIKENGPLRDYMGQPIMTQTDDSNPLWLVFKNAITSVGGKLSKLKILGSTIDSRFVRLEGKEFLTLVSHQCGIYSHLAS